MDYHIARIQYFYDKLEYLRNGTYPYLNNQAEFELFTFFEVCYHLKDYIKEDKSYLNYRNVEKYINENKYLRICADICNRLKHKKLKSNRSKKEIGHFHLVIHATIGMRPAEGEPPLDNKRSLVSATIDTEIGKVCCYSLANNCLIAWNDYWGKEKFRIKNHTI